LENEDRVETEDISESPKKDDPTKSSRKLALVTGASSGIGVDFARELARRNHDLLLAARRVERLEEVKAELLGEFPNTTIGVVPCDLNQSNGAQQLFDDVEALGFQVDVLVNNAGLGRFGSFLEQSIEEIEAMIQVNVTSLTVLARLFGADMAERGGGVILNHASFSAIQPTPDFAVYSGAKSYVLSFSQALEQNIRSAGVKVSALCPGFFRSEFLDEAGQDPSFITRCIMLDRRKVARAGVKGALRGKTIIIPGILYKMLNLGTRFLPRPVITGLADIAVKH